MQKIGFIGHREVKNAPLVELKIARTLERKFPEAVCFNFGSNSQFNDLCWQVVSTMQQRNCNIEMNNFCCGNEKPFLKENKVDGKQYFDNIIFPENAKNAGKRIYVERNKALIDASDVLIFYYNANYKPAFSNSGTKIAFEYAARCNKVIINLFE